MKMSGRNKPAKKKIECKECGKLYTNRQHYVEHQRLHDGIYCFICPKKGCGLACVYLAKGLYVHFRVFHKILNKKDYPQHYTDFENKLPKVGDEQLNRYRKELKEKRKVQHQRLNRNAEKSMATSTEPTLQEELLEEGSGGKEEESSKKNLPEVSFDAGGVIRVGTEALATAGIKSVETFVGKGVKRKRSDRTRLRNETLVETDEETDIFSDEVESGSSARNQKRDSSASAHETSQKKKLSAEAEEEVRVNGGGKKKRNHKDQADKGHSGSATTAEPSEKTNSKKCSKNQHSIERSSSTAVDETMAEDLVHEEKKRKKKKKETKKRKKERKEEKQKETQNKVELPEEDVPGKLNNEEAVSVELEKGISVDTGPDVNVEQSVIAFEGEQGDEKVNEVVNELLVSRNDYDETISEMIDSLKNGQPTKKLRKRIAKVLCAGEKRVEEGIAVHLRNAIFDEYTDTLGDIETRIVEMSSETIKKYDDYCARLKEMLSRAWDSRRRDAERLDYMVGEKDGFCEKLTISDAKLQSLERKFKNKENSIRILTRVSQRRLLALKGKKCDNEKLVESLAEKEKELLSSLESLAEKEKELVSLRETKSDETAADLEKELESLRGECKEFKKLAADAMKEKETVESESEKLSDQHRDFFVEVDSLLVAEKVVDPKVFQGFKGFKCLLSQLFEELNTAKERVRKLEAKVDDNEGKKKTVWTDLQSKKEECEQLKEKLSKTAHRQDVEDLKEQLSAETTNKSRVDAENKMLNEVLERLRKKCKLREIQFASLQSLIEITTVKGKFVSSLKGFYFSVIPLSDNWSHGSIQLDEVDLSCLMNVSSKLTDNCYEFSLTYFMESLPPGKRVVGVLDSREFYFSKGDFWREINEAKYLMNVPEGFTETDDPNFEMPPDLIPWELDEKKVYKTRKKGAKTAMARAVDNRDFKVKMVEYVALAVGHAKRNREKEGRQGKNSMFSKKGLFFTICHWDHFMSLLFLRGEKLETDERNIFMNLFPSGTAFSIKDELVNFDRISVDLTKDCWVFMDSCLDLCYPRVEIFQAVRHFVHLTFMDMTCLADVPAEMRDAACYVAEVAQQSGEKNMNCGLHVLQNIEDLMKGREMQLKPDMVEKRKELLQAFVEKMEQAKEQGTFRLKKPITKQASRKGSQKKVVQEEKSESVTSAKNGSGVTCAVEGSEGGGSGAEQENGRSSVESNE